MTNADQITNTEMQDEEVGIVQSQDTGGLPKKAVDLLRDDSTVSNAEKKVIAALMVDPARAASKVFLRLKAKDFHLQQCRIIFEIIVNLYQQSKEISLAAVASVIEDRKLPIALFDDDLYSYLLSICSLHVSTMLVDDFLEIIKKAAIVRELNNFADNLKSRTFDLVNFEKELSNLQLNFQALLNESETSHVEQIGKFVVSFEKKFVEGLKGNVVSGVKSGFFGVDRLTGGWQNGEFIVIAARPGKGKTAFALNLAAAAAEGCSAEECVVIFSLEMGIDQIIQRLVSIDSWIKFSLTSAPFLSRSDSSKIYSSLQKLATTRIYISDDGNVNVLQIYNHLKKLISSKIKPKLVIVDYLQLIRPVQQYKNFSNRQEEVSFISRNLKLAARTLEIPIIACAQLSRKIEERSSKGKEAIPQLSDLRESGAIEQDADIVSFLYNDSVQDSEETNPYENENKPERERINCNWLLAKNRNGPTGVVSLMFFPSTSRFVAR